MGSPTQMSHESLAPATVHPRKLVAATAVFENLEAKGTSPQGGWGGGVEVPGCQRTHTSRRVNARAHAHLFAQAGVPRAREGRGVEGRRRGVDEGRRIQRSDVALDAHAEP